MPAAADGVSNREIGSLIRMLNQVELFFSIMQRRLLRYGEFSSVDDLADRVIAFINADNQKAKRYRWTYNGRPLQAA